MLLWVADATMALTVLSESQLLLSHADIPAPMLWLLYAICISTPVTVTLVLPVVARLLACILDMVTPSNDTIFVPLPLLMPADMATRRVWTAP